MKKLIIAINLMVFAGVSFASGKTLSNPSADTSNQKDQIEEAI